MEDLGLIAQRAATGRGGACGPGTSIDRLRHIQPEEDLPLDHGLFSLQPSTETGHKGGKQLGAPGPVVIQTEGQAERIRDFPGVLPGEGDGPSALPGLLGREVGMHGRKDPPIVPLLVAIEAGPGPDEDPVLPGDVDTVVRTGIPEPVLQQAVPFGSGKRIGPRKVPGGAAERLDEAHAHFEPAPVVHLPNPPGLVSEGPDLLLRGDQPARRRVGAETVPVVPRPEADGVLRTQLIVHRDPETAGAFIPLSGRGARRAFPGGKSSQDSPDSPVPPPEQIPVEPHGRPPAAGRRRVGAAPGEGGSGREPLLDFPVEGKVPGAGT